MKTTVPELFEVTPSQGSLSPGQSKAISFRATRVIVIELLLSRRRRRGG